jgi:hypothetical protein
MKNTILIVSFLIVFTISFDSFAQDKIEKSKNEIKKDSRSHDNNKRKHSDSSSATFGADDSFENMIARVFVQGFLFVTYYTAIGNYDSENHLHSKLSNYPYYNNRSGNYESTDSISASKKSFRFDLEDKLLYSHESLFGNHLNLKIRPFQYFYLQTDFVQLIEYNEIRKDYSNLSLFGINLCYDRIRFEKFNLGWTLGLNYIGNDVKKAGFSYGLNAEIFTAKYLSVYSSMKWSSINDAPVNEFELQLKYHRKRYFFTIGYEHLKIASPTYNFMSIGVGIYF